VRGGVGDNFMSFVDEASGFKKVYGIESARTTVALVPSSVGETAMWTYALNVSICQELLAAFTVSLIPYLLFEIIMLPEIEVYRLTYLSMLRGGSTSKEVKPYVEPFVGLFV
jgi:hypothetical protein